MTTFRPGVVLVGAVVAGAVLLLGGCSGELQVDSYPTEPNTTINCKALFADGPLTVANQKRTLVKDENALAWGDPAIIVRCGVEKPDGLDRSSRCDTIDDIDWFTDTTADGYLFTTIGREFYISVEVPQDYDPAADALADLTDAVEQHDPSVEPCRG